jgi:putative PIN family toxin of toxin-antitoxin system
MKYRILVDTNILFSALLYPGGTPGRTLIHVSETQHLILSDYNISELREVFSLKVPGKAEAIEVLLDNLNFEQVIAPISPDKRISDPKDAPVLNAALVAEVDILITGDNHFRNIGLKKPLVMSAAEYVKFMKLP